MNKKPSARTKTAVNIDDYVRRFPKDVQQRLQQMRATIKKVAPQAAETISYGVPAFQMDGILIWFAAFEKHIGLYPGAAAIAAFDDELTQYKRAKGSVRFPHDEPLPLATVRRIVSFRLKQASTKKKQAATGKSK